MGIKIRTGGWSSDELIIETSRGEAKIWMSGYDLRVEGEEVLREVGLSLSDAIAMYFDRAAGKDAREKYQNYLSRKGG